MKKRRKRYIFLFFGGWLLHIKVFSEETLKALPSPKMETSSIIFGKGNFISRILLRNVQP